MLAQAAQARAGEDDDHDRRHGDRQLDQTQHQPAWAEFGRHLVDFRPRHRIMVANGLGRHAYSWAAWRLCARAASSSASATPARSTGSTWQLKRARYEACWA